MRRLIKFLVFCICILCLVSCSPKIQATLNSQNHLSYDISIHLDTSLQEFLEPFLSSAEQENFINPVQIENFLNQSKSSQNYVTFKDNILSIKGTYLQPLQELKTSFFEITKKDTCTQLAITLLPEVIQEKLFTSPQEIQDICEMLMLPLYTGENLTKEEYLEQIAGLYGKNFAKKLQTSEITLTFTGPKALEKVSIFPKTLGIYKINQNSVTFSIPLTHFVTTIEKTALCIQWGN